MDRDVGVRGLLRGVRVSRLRSAPALALSQEHLGCGCRPGPRLRHDARLPGWRAVVSISVLGMMFGGLAAWRKTLRIGMVAHAWQDVWAGWLSRALAGRFDRPRQLKNRERFSAGGKGQAS